MVKQNEKKLAGGILFTDMYQLTMAQLYFRMGLREKFAQFDYFFRSYPDYGNHKAGYGIFAGLEWLLNWMKHARFRKDDLECLRIQKGRNGEKLFHEDFLEWLEQNGRFDRIDMWCVPEGRVVHANVPLAVVQGPLIMAQILESSLLNHLNYPTLIATKASRIREAGKGKLLLEFGMRRGHGMGVNAGARAALIGGAHFTSNTGISCELGYPPKGTHAHSMVQAFMAMGEGELGAFRAYADIYPDDCLLLVDTIDTLESGMPNAIRVFEELRKKGHKPMGIRLDSGDLAYLSIQAAKMLNNAGFPDTSIVLSNQLDELSLWQIISQIEKEASRYGVDPDHLVGRLVYGVGTSLITSKGDAALDGVYKLVALRKNKNWVPAIKISETPAKTLNPGFKRILRIYDARGMATADLVCVHDEKVEDMETLLLHHPTEHDTFRTLERGEISRMEPLLIQVLKQGKPVYKLPSIEGMREVRDLDLNCLDSGVRRLMNPHIYHVSLTEKLWNLKQELIRSALTENRSSG